jgi:hypothetical protein
MPYRIADENAAGEILSAAKDPRNYWCREGESIPAIFKGIVKIPSIVAKRNTDAAFARCFALGSKNTSGEFRVIWGDFGRRFTRKS